VGVVDVLRRVYEALAPGGTILDLRSVPPPGRVEIDGQVLGELDESAFFPRSHHNGEALADLARNGLLELEAEDDHTMLIVYPTGRNLVDDVADWGDTKVPDELAARLLGIDRECRIREFCVARSYRRAA
jgi:hypothetical protein